jgi:hypothetical protein
MVKARIKLKARIKFNRRRTAPMLRNSLLLARSRARLSAPILSALAILAVLAMTPTGAQAFNAGRDGSSVGGCTPCHSNTAGVTVGITGPASLATGATGLYTLTVFGAGLPGPPPGGALDVSTSGGTLTTAQGDTKVQNGEITHDNGNPDNVGVFAFNFNLTAPVVAGAVTLFGAGMKYNGDFGTSGDFWNTTTWTVQVPEPGTALLVGLSLVGLAVVGRRPRA